MIEKAGIHTTSGATKLLLVDDEPDINIALKVVLQRAGFIVDTFDDPVTALDQFKPEYYDLLILDVKMPKMDGFELYQKIKKTDEHVKVCFLTASELYYETFRKGKYLTIDKELFIRKPITNRELLDKINFILNTEKIGKDVDIR
jgi:DNA-binding response OmpR family regulator